MTKKKRFVVILAVLLMGLVVFAGCGSNAEENSGANGDEGLSSGQEVESGEQTETQEQDTVTAAGILKAVNTDDGMITVETENSGELELQIVGTSKILLGETTATLTQLTDKIDSEVNVEYNAGTKEVTVLNLQE